MDGSAAIVKDEAVEEDQSRSNKADWEPGSDRRNTTGNPGSMPNSATNQPLPRADVGANLPRVADGGAGNLMKGIAGENFATNNYENGGRGTPGGYVVSSVQIQYEQSCNPSSDSVSIITIVVQ